MGMIRRDCKPVFLGSSKAKSLTLQRKKPAKLVWTQAWRRLHKKGLAETTTKKRTRRVTKVGRAVVGLSLEDIKKKAGQKSELRSKEKAAALKEVKARKGASGGRKSGAVGRSASSVGAGQHTKMLKTVQRNNRAANKNIGKR